MHIPHDSRPEGQGTKHRHPICHLKLQPPQTPSPTKGSVVAFAEKDCNDGKILEICTMEQLEKDLPRNWIPERKCQEKMSEFFKNPFMKKDDEFLKSPVEAPVHRKVLLEDKNTSPKT